MFISYSCEQTDEVLTEKQSMTAIISCAGVLHVLIYLTVLHYFKRHSDLSQLKWDLQTVTPGDYTMQLEITQSMWDDFKDHAAANDKYRTNGKSLVSNFKEHMKTELEQILNQRLQKIKEEDRKLEADGKKAIYCGVEVQQVIIADIVFAFDNYKVIELLKKRGTHIMYNKYEESR